MHLFEKGSGPGTHVPGFYSASNLRPLYLAINRLWVDSLNYNASLPHAFSKYAYVKNEDATPRFSNKYPRVLFGKVNIHMVLLSIYGSPEVTLRDNKGTKSNRWELDIIGYLGISTWLVWKHDV